VFDNVPREDVIKSFVAEWKALAHGYAVMPPDVQLTLAAQGVPMRELARDPRRVVVSRQ